MFVCAYPRIMFRFPWIDRFEILFVFPWSLKHAGWPQGFCRAAGCLLLLWSRFSLDPLNRSWLLFSAFVVSLWIKCFLSFLSFFFFSLFEFASPPFFHLIITPTHPHVHTFFFSFVLLAPSVTFFFFFFYPPLPWLNPLV